MQRGSWRSVEINNQKQTKQKKPRKVELGGVSECRYWRRVRMSECRYWRLVQATNTDIAAAAWAAKILRDHHDDEERYAL